LSASESRLINTLTTLTNTSSLLVQVLVLCFSSKKKRMKTRAILLIWKVQTMKVQVLRVWVLIVVVVVVVVIVIRRLNYNPRWWWNHTMNKPGHHKWKLSRCDPRQQKLGIFGEEGDNGIISTKRRLVPVVFVCLRLSLASRFSIL